jgi:homospermidine synthase
VLAAVLWMMENPSEGVRLPDDLPHEFVLEKAKPYLGPFVSERSSWDPLSSWKDPFEGFGVPKPSENARWQFPTFLVQAPW